MKSGQATPIPPGEFTVGRADDTYVHLDDASVSRHHAMILNNDTGFFVEDLSSANGTAARGAYITRRTKINFGDVVFFGSVPFRVDHELEGEADVAPSAGMRTSNRAYMRRDTERLPPPGALARPVETLSPEALSAPEVNPDTDIDAGALNAVTLREPEIPVAASHSGSQPGSGTTQQATPMRQAVPIPTPSRPAQPQQQPGPRPSRQAEVPQYSTQNQEGRASEQASPDQTATSASWEWLLLSFLAGMGTGLLLALYFAKLFIELGGKASSLP